MKLHLASSSRAIRRRMWLVAEAVLRISTALWEDKNEYQVQKEDNRSTLGHSCVSEGSHISISNNSEPCTGQTLMTAFLQGAIDRLNISQVAPIPLSGSRDGGKVNHSLSFLLLH